MATAAQINANRQNAQRSTGPQSTKGKARSALNALDHGLRARIILEDTHAITGERATPFAALLVDLVAELAPVGVLESHCVETIALSIWRLRLVIRKELDLVAEVDSEDMLDTLLPPLGSDGQPTPAPAAFRPLPHPEKLLPLVRYEAHLDRQMRRARADLQQLQAARLANAALEAPAPPREPSSLPVPPAHCSADPSPQPVDAAASAPRSSSIILPNEAIIAPVSAVPSSLSPLPCHLSPITSTPIRLSAAYPLTPALRTPPSRAGKSLPRAERGGARGLGPPSLPNEPNFATAFAKGAPAGSEKTTQSMAPPKWCGSGFWSASSSTTRLLSPQSQPGYEG